MNRIFKCISEPIADLTTFGEYISVVPFVHITVLIPAASAVLKIVPRFA